MKQKVKNKQRKLSTNERIIRGVEDIRKFKRKRESIDVF
tara:strand:+ start:391 stop:507 length:117 start_codon:yes stop_codon:yes gene_type:complete